MLYKTDFQKIKVFKKGKVRDVYEFDQKLLLIATDRISCFDVVLPTPVPDKGKVLNQISLFWFSFLKDSIDNHLISSNLRSLPSELQGEKEILDKRFMITRKSKVIPFECVVRGYLCGSGWKEYKKTGKVCGITLPAGLRESEKLRNPIFTPATKAEAGHDENVDFDYIVSGLGEKLAQQLRDISIKLYKKARDYAEGKGIIIADTKFEFGIHNDKLILIDEVLTPDSSRFWPLSNYTPGRPQANFDKQFVRDYLETLDWDKTPPAPTLPQEVVDKTREKYVEVLKRLTGYSL